MPATTGISAVPIGRPGLEAQLGTVPTFYLSDSARADAKGTATPQLAALLELDRFIHLPGLVFGGRMFGPNGDTLVEPYVGYRAKIAEDFAVGGGVFGTAKRSEARLASYHGTRIGGELQLDAKLWEPASWFALHGQAALSATRIEASGTYCVNDMGIAIDCDVEDTTLNTMISGQQEGVYPAATGTAVFDFGRDSTRRFRGVRLAALAAAGTMPLVRDGEKTATGMYTTFGLTLTLTLALADGDPQ